MYLLTLDLATHTGWTRGLPEDRHFAYGTYVLPKGSDDVGAFLQAYEQWLIEALASVTLCVFEAPILPKVTSLATCRKLYGLAGVTEMICADFGIKCRSVNPMTIKAFISPRMRHKADMVTAIRRYGYDPKSHDEADAIGLRLYVLNLLFPGASKKFGLELGMLGACA